MTTQRHLIGLFAFVLGCESDPSVCTVACAADADCPGGQTCGPVGRCTDGPACPCEAGAFVACAGDGAEAMFCAATGDDVRTEACAGGCNVEAGRCNACVPGAVTCSTDHATYDTCRADGSELVRDACGLPCVDASDDRPAHCGYIAPTFLPDVCDAPAAEPAFGLGTTATIDTGVDAICNGGIVVQASGTQICVVRYATIQIPAARSYRVIGARVLALVADGELTVAGTLDASAGGAASGRVVAGDRALPGSGGGGAGFRTAGGNGGAASTGTGGAGGAMLAPSPGTTGVTGGPRATPPTLPQQSVGYPAPGAGGGAVVLVACRGTVAVGGTIDVNGGGGEGGRGVTTGAIVGGAGGGAGGFVVMEGIEVVVTGSVFANGGGGGGGCATAGCIGNAGQPGQRATTPAAGGIGFSDSGTGGAGGTGATPPSPGIGGASLPGKGGGGGAAGWLWAATPAGTAPVITPAAASPSFEAKVVETR